MVEGGSADFILEIGTEELPPADAETAIAQLERGVPRLLTELRLDYEAISIQATPRRLVIHISGLQTQQPDREQVFRGPPADRAYDSDGNPTRAAEGFARSQGLTPGDLQIQEVSGGRYVTAAVFETGLPAYEVLSTALPTLIAGIKFPKSMRWNDENLSFSRPIRWLMALHGEQVVEFEYAGLKSTGLSRPLRFHKPEQVAVKSPAGYFQFLRDSGIILDVEERRSAILVSIQELAAQVGGIVPEDDDLLSEVTYLVEAPTALIGTFDNAYLDLPREVLISVMKKHQRYFHVVRGNNGGQVSGKQPAALLPNFITVRNGDDTALEIVTEGNEHVVRARFADAAFFIRNDRKRKLDDFRMQLDSLTFEARLGSMLDKTIRIESIVRALIPTLGLNQEEEKVALRAAHLCKTDLASEMVVEMTSLQGVMGRYYALESGESDQVASAIEEHYLPRNAGDRSPRSKEALIVGLADRLDSLTGLFSVGLGPSGNKDPFGLRRAALGLVQLLVDWEIDIDLEKAIRSAGRRQALPVSEEIQAEVLNFIIERLRNYLLDQQYAYDVVDAVLAAQGKNPAPAIRTVGELQKWVQRPDWGRILPAFSRCARITRNYNERFPVDPKLFQEPASLALFEALQLGEARAAPGSTSANDFLEAFLPMMPAVDQFFEDVLVMVEDESLRNNRLGTLQRIVALSEGVADLSRLEGF